MAEGLYCYQCEQGYPVAVHPPRCNDVGDRVCPHCASDFIELRQVSLACLTLPMNTIGQSARVAGVFWQADLAFCDHLSWPAKFEGAAVSNVSFVLKLFC